MLTIRKFLRTLIGKATPVQILLACVLGSMLGFLPITNGAQVPALLALSLLLVLDANIFLAGLVTAATKLLSIATAPLAFAIGRLLIDGPTEPLARVLINGPVTAWLGFDSYLATGGLVLGLVVGLAVGLVVARLVGRLRSALAGLEESSPAFKALMATRSVRWSTWLLFGGVPKGGFTALAAKKGLPIRWSGVGVAVVMLLMLATVGWLLSAGAAREVLVRSLERVNGATVDVDEVEIDWFDGRASIAGLAVCDATDLDHDLFRAGRLTATLDLDALLRRRLAIDLVQAEEARIEASRESPGRLTIPAPEPVEEDREPELDPEGNPLPGGRLEDYLATAREWRERLEQVQRVVEDLADRLPDRGDPTETGESTDEAGGDTLEDWLRTQIDLHGYAGVRASHLVEEAPRLLVRRVEATGVEGPRQDVTWDLEMSAISTEPRLVEDPASISVRSSDGLVTADISLEGIAAGGGENRIDLMVRELPSADIVDQLLQSNEPPFKGGTIDAAIQGAIALRPTVELEAPLDVVLRQSTIQVGGESATIPELPVRFRISGRLDDPRITLDADAFAEALQNAGADALAQRARSEAEDQIDRGLGNLERKTGITIPDDLREGIGKGLGDLFGGGDD